MLVKVCGMREPENIRDLEEKIQPDWMGLIFYAKSPRFVGDEKAQELAEVNLPKVGVFVNETLENVLVKIQSFQLAAVQLHGNESPAYVRELKLKTDKKLWKVVSVGDSIDWETLRDYVGLVDCFLFDTATKKHGGSGKKFNWELLKSYPFKVPFILSGGLDENSVEELLQLEKEIPQLTGVDLNSKFEDAPGLKNIEKLRSFKNKIRP
ncbi:phosphoribosylanthranilate isomerase [Algoriphagus halophytocola]|uniref:N-(5'-phosphoribosyl)anthranilate isomerase n=1 Tax=Algoriphagus halophytocola TaxID=2991499 RepID=A0ABY6MJ64_9BACT|nr:MULTISPECIES: phosphoribosylanthranilate isomerase [unclassified Algoriphagus]UZD22462.1 phosphoribosylanthranilate isomerase [Algoriphagus sp. TR-M5]WBL43722.1 phosphoribosylanthranilate isomerase [Algoriphagus sp. TR-M9]